jgi:hypothetical protein
VYFTIKVPSPGATPIPTPPLSTKPEGKADYLVVLVHGCCTDANDIRNEWYPFGRLIAERIVRKPDWEIVVWDWHERTSKHNYLLELHKLRDDANEAYDAAGGDDTNQGEGIKLANAIIAAEAEKEHPYEYIHLIAHSAGADLIDQAATKLEEVKRQQNMEKPFIHLTFLDAYAPSDHPKDRDRSLPKDRYGSLPNDYLKHYSEHYVDKGLPLIEETDDDLPHAFNFDVTDW